MTNKPEYAPLRASWTRFKNRSSICEEWQKFETFFKDVLALGWEVGDMIIRPDSDSPVGPDNVYIQKCDRRKMEEAKADEEAKLAATKGGYKNSPCIGCPKNLDGVCDYYKKCKEYRRWFSVSWRDIQKAAENLKA